MHRAERPLANRGLLVSLVCRTLRWHRRAYTLIELVVVLVILAIVSVIGAYALTGFGHRFDAASAQASIDRVVVAEHTVASTYGGYSSWPADIEAGQGVTITDGASTSSSTVSLALGSNGDLGLAAQSTQGTCVAVGLSSLNATPPGTATTASVASGTPCTGQAALAALWPTETPVAPATVHW